MSISALYYYFSSKEELLFSIQYNSFDGVLRGLEGKLEGDTGPERKPYLLIRACFARSAGDEELDDLF